MSRLSKLIMESVSLIGDLKNLDLLAIEMTSSALQPVAGKHLLTAAKARAVPYTASKTIVLTAVLMVNSFSLSSTHPHLNSSHSARDISCTSTLLIADKLRMFCAGVSDHRPIQEIQIEKARGRFPGAGFSIFVMMKICR